jgi:hypothetical protein
MCPLSGQAKDLGDRALARLVWSADFQDDVHQGSSNLLDRDTPTFGAITCSFTESSETAGYRRFDGGWQ